MQFERTIGVDYSGAETADASLKGLRVYLTERGGSAVETGPPPGPKRYWTRRALAQWLTARFAEPVPTIAGIDHTFSFPAAYFAHHALPHDWDSFLDDFHDHWPTDEPNVYVDFLRHKTMQTRHRSFLLLNLDAPWASAIMGVSSRSSRQGTLRHMQR